MDVPQLGDPTRALNAGSSGVGAPSLSIANDLFRRSNWARAIGFWRIWVEATGAVSVAAPIYVKGPRVREQGT